MEFTEYFAFNRPRITVLLDNTRRKEEVTNTVMINPLTI